MYFEQFCSFRFLCDLIYVHGVISFFSHVLFPVVFKCVLDSVQMLVGIVPLWFCPNEGLLTGQVDKENPWIGADRSTVVTPCEQLPVAKNVLQTLGGRRMPEYSIFYHLQGSA